MKKISIIKFVTSIILMFLVSALVSFVFTGNPAAILPAVFICLFAFGFIKGLLGIANERGLLYDALVINDTTYAGEVASYMISRAVVGSDTVDKGCIYVEDGIKKSKTIPRIEVSNLFQKRSATPVSSGQITIDGKTIVPQDMMLYLEFNPREFEAHWYAEQMKPRLLDAELPVTVENFMTMQVMLRVAEFNEKHIWNGRKSYDLDGDSVDPTSKGARAADAVYLYYDGLIKKALDDANTLKVASPVSLTSSNIRAKFNAALALVPEGLMYKYGALGLRYYVSYVDQQKYEESLRSDPYKNNDTTEKSINRYGGYDVVPLAGLPENTFFLGVGRPDTESNLWLGMNSKDDVELELKRLQANSELFFIKGLFKIDAQIGFNDQIVLYTTQVA